MVLDITRGTGEDQVATAIMVAQATTLAIVATMAMVVQTTTAIMVGPVIILAGKVIPMVVDLITMAITLADLTIIMATMGAQATTLEVAEVVLITTGTMVGQGTTLAATATMEVVGLITTGTTMEVLDTTPADLMTMATTAMVGAVTTQVATGQVGEGATLDLRPTGRWWVRLLEVESTFFLDQFHIFLFSCCSCGGSCSRDWRHMCCKTTLQGSSPVRSVRTWS